MKLRVLPVLALVPIFFGCVRAPEPERGEPRLSPAQKLNMPYLRSNLVNGGVLRVKFSPEAASILESATLRSESTIKTRVPALDATIASLGGYEMKRVFRHGGKYEERRRRAGLHLWYEIRFDERTDVLDAAGSLAELEEVVRVEGEAIIEPVGGYDRTPVVATEEMLAEMRQAAGTRAPLYLFNDPNLVNQWHYQNYALREGFVAGADVNLFKAWEIEVGKPEVIVAVNDDAFDFRHIDLAANVHVNRAEAEGVKGVDDDNNGYVDDIYGYNFVEDSGTLYPGQHGTHVAGTVAAVNNNGIGVCGVAGGDGSPDSGVRLIACQIFQERNSKPGNTAEAIVYGADNGAVISQNSWSQKFEGNLPDADREALEYFIRYAGTGPDGEQTGPMKGGIAIFAAGNEGKNGRYMPGYDPLAFTVVSMGPDFKKAPYSNYGDWTQITAPGGNTAFGTEGAVLSLLSDNQYGWIYGTSMACPHVSGIAALAVSKYGTAEKGFTATRLRELLLESVDDIYPHNPGYIGQMGAGYINAYRVLSQAGGKAPQPVSDMEVTWTFESALLRWTVPAELNGGRAVRYDILWSENPLAGIDFSDLPEETSMQIVRTGGAIPGDVIRSKVSGLELGKTYYVGIAAADNEGNRSPLKIISGTTVPNRPPVVRGLPSTINLTSSQQQTISLDVEDIEGYSWGYTFSGGSQAASIRKESGDRLSLSFNALRATPADYTATLTLTDEQGLENKIAIPYRIAANNAPQLNPQHGSEFVISGIEAIRRFDLTSFFVDADNDVLRYELRLMDPSLAAISHTDGVLTARSKKVGSSDLVITAFDPREASAKVTVKLICREAHRQMDLFPVPVKKDGVLNIRLGDEADGEASVALYNTSTGAHVFTGTVVIAPNAPGQINISSLSSGYYRVVVTFEGQEMSKNISKL